MIERCLSELKPGFLQIVFSRICRRVHDNLIHIRMDKLLKPKDLDMLPTVSNAASVFKYWIATFESFLQAGQAAIDPSVEVNQRGLTR